MCALFRITFTYLSLLERMEEVKTRKKEVGRKEGRQGGKEQDDEGKIYINASDRKVIG